MKLYSNMFLLIGVSFLINGCVGGGSSPGYWFQILLIVVPLFIIGYIMINKFDSLNDMIFTLETKINKLSDRIEDLESFNKKGKSKK